MEANNLTISIPPDDDGKICDKNCEYCISRMVGYIDHDYEMVMRNIAKVRTVSKAAGVSSVLITGKGEPLLHFNGVIKICDYFKDYPLELQTNGLWLNKNLSALEELKKWAAMDVIAFSIDCMEQINDFAEMFGAIQRIGLTVRVCLNLTSKIPKIGFKGMLEVIKLYPINQLLVRNIMVPKKLSSTSESAKTVEWVKNNTDLLRYKTWNTIFMDMVTEDDLNRSLPHGAKVYDLPGDSDMSVSFSDYCIQEANNTRDIRSLIFLEDGHLYTSWDKKSSRIF